MIRVETIEDLQPALRDRIKAKVMRRLIAHLRERPHIGDEALRRVFGCDRAELEALCASISDPSPPANAQPSRRASTPPPRPVVRARS